MDATVPATGPHARGGDAGSPRPTLPESVVRASTAAVVEFVVGAALVDVAFLTNSVPVPSFPRRGRA